MSDKRPYTPTAEQLALAEIRKQLRREKTRNQAIATETASAAEISDPLLSRPWLKLDSNPTLETPLATHRVKLLTWNLLAQCLIRRELFPNSDCLKVTQRESIIHKEILRQNADILCLQEVDRLEKLLPVLEKAGYSHHYASGPRKLHGCLVAFKKHLYSLASDKVIYYDEQSAGIGHDRIGATFKTKNIGNIVALKKTDDEKQGVIVATTHLFWHPRYTYERIRQVGILIREVSIFRERLNADQWPAIVAGDFNFSPSDPAYSLITGDSLLPTQEEIIPASMVIHSSLDPTILTSSRIKSTADDEAEDVDPDRHITNARTPTEEDGLLSILDLVQWFSKLPNLRSIYNDGLCEGRKLGIDLSTYGTRTELPANRHGANEPEYTSYTHYWQAVLDYIFVLDPSNSPVTVLGLLAPLKANDMAPGLPQKRVSGSDHTCLVAELAW